MTSKQNQKTLRDTQYYGLTKTFDSLYEKSLAGKVQSNLMEIISSENNILLAYSKVKTNKGSKTAGVDGKTIDDMNKLSTEEFISLIKGKFQNYNPKKVKRVDIPKPNGDLRPLGIPSIEDRIIQQCILQVLDPICEAKFHENSNGFRPNRSCETAISQTYRMLQRQKLHFVVNIDIKGFFDNVNHNKLRRQLWDIGIHDKKLITIINKMLKSKIVMPDGTTVEPTKGTPQGGILSPLLSNIVLNELDQWLSSQWQSFPSTHTYSKNDKKYKSLRKTGLKEIHFVRYADDFNIFCSNYEDANRIKHATIKWLNERLKLEVNQTKTKIVNTRKNSFEFLGFDIRVHDKGNKWVVTSRINSGAKRSITAKLKNQISIIQRSQNNKAELFKAVTQYNKQVMGIHNYYNIATMVSEDCSDIGRMIDRTIISKIKVCEKPKTSDKLVVSSRYKNSKQIKLINHKYILLPIGYIQNQKPMQKRKAVNKYTVEGRKALTSSIEIDKEIEYLLNTTNYSRSVEYNNNRVARYTMQQGKCAVSSVNMTGSEIHCHHILPSSLGGTDSYDNLVIISNAVHKLIHATQEDTIAKYLAELKLTPTQITKLNTYRNKVGNESVNLN